MGQFEIPLWIEKDSSSKTLIASETDSEPTSTVSPQEPNQKAATGNPGAVQHLQERYG
jgi:hypothetical protein